MKAFCLNMISDPCDHALALDHTHAPYMKSRKSLLFFHHNLLSCLLNRDPNLIPINCYMICRLHMFKSLIWSLSFNPMIFLILINCYLGA